MWRSCHRKSCDQAEINAHDAFVSPPCEKRWRSSHLRSISRVFVALYRHPGMALADRANDSLAPEHVRPRGEVIHIAFAMARWALHGRWSETAAIAGRQSYRPASRRAATRECRFQAFRWHAVADKIGNDDDAALPLQRADRIAAFSWP